MTTDTFEQIIRDVVECDRCTRLREHCAEIALTKRRAYRNEEYWGRPVPGFGDPKAGLVVIGLAPGAHGANRTGRMFTGDGSGDWLYRALFRFGFASQATSECRGDGLELRDTYVTAVGRCAPPQNKLKASEIRACRPFLERELRLLTSARALLCLGRVAYDTTARLLVAWGWIEKRDLPPFGHGVACSLGEGRPVLLGSYHPSRQNTQTGRLTEKMLDDVVASARRIVDGTGQQAVRSS